MAGATSPGRRWSAAVVAVVFVLALVASACTSESSSSTSSSTVQSRAAEGRPEAGGSLVMALEGETDGWDPIANIWTKNAHYVASTVYDPLGIVNDVGEVEPYLAENIEHNDDYTEWIITVPEGVEFHDGEILDAQAVATNINARKTSGLNIFLWQTVGDITVDGNQVHIPLSEPWVAFDYTLTQQSGYMVAPSLIGTGELSQHPVGTGPFVFESWEPDKSFVATRNDDYWGKDEFGQQLPYLDQIEFRPIADPLARADSLKTGDIDAMVSSDVKTVEGLEDQGFKVAIDNIGEEGYIFLNTKSPPLDNKLVREALAYATNPQEVVDIAFDGKLEVASGPFHPDEKWYDPDTGYVEYDPAKARELVQQYEDETGETISFTLTGNPDDRERGAILQQQWKDVGIDVEIEDLEFAQFTSRLIRGELQAGFVGNLGYADPDFMYVFFHPDFVENKINFSQIAIPEVGENFDLARQSGDFETRKKAYGDAIRAWNEEFPDIWLYHQQTALVSQPDVNGLIVAESVGFARVDSKPFLARIWIGENGG
jgi:peptide/nickel transport system substrate-binding protein